MSKGRFILGISAVFLSVSFITPGLFAGTEEGRHNLDAYARYLPSRSVKSDSGKIEIIDTQAEYSYDLELCAKLPIRFSVLTQYIGMDNTTALELPARLVGAGSDIETTLPFFNFPETYLRFGLSPGFYGDSWDFEPSEFRIPSRCLLIKRPNEKLTLLAGVALYPGFENEVLPVLGFIYQPNQKWLFHIVPKRPSLSYFYTERLVIFAEAGSSLNSEFEVTRLRSNNVVLSYKERHIGAGLAYKLGRNCKLTLSAGQVFNRMLKYLDGEGKLVIKDGLYSELRIKIKL